MSRKTVPVRKHRRSTPSTPPYGGPGNKPGPKTVKVVKHKRSKSRKWQRQDIMSTKTYHCCTQLKNRWLACKKGRQ